MQTQNVRLIDLKPGDQVLLGFTPKSIKMVTFRYLDTISLDGHEVMVETENCKGWVSEPGGVAVFEDTEEGRELAIPYGLKTNVIRLTGHGLGIKEPK